MGQKKDQVNKASYPTEIYIKNKLTTTPLPSKEEIVCSKFSLFSAKNNIKSNINLNN